MPESFCDLDLPPEPRIARVWRIDEDHANAARRASSPSAQAQGRGR
jgi:hypothetical protein